MKKNKLFLALLPTLLSASVYADDTMFARYNMSVGYEDQPFAGTLHDTTANARHGTVHGPKMTADYMGGGEAGAYWFDGVDDYLSMPATDYTPFYDDFSLSFMAKSCVSGEKTALSLGSSEEEIIVVNFDNGSGIEFILNGESFHVGNIGDFSDGKWHWILIRRSGDTVEFVVDREVRATTQVVGAVGASADFRIGGDTHPWNGGIDDFIIFDRALTDEAEFILYDYYLNYYDTVWEIATCNANFLRRDGVGALVFKDKLWLLGGWNCTTSDGSESPNSTSFDPNPSCTSSEVWSSVDGANWTLETKAPWPSRHMAGWVVFQDKMWVIGGDANNAGKYQNDVWWSEDGVNWHEEKGDFGWKNRILHHVVVFKDKIWLMGGQSDSEKEPVTTYNDIWSSTDGIKWRLEKKHAAWSPRGAILGSAVFKDKLWLIGGGVYNKEFKNEVWYTSDGKRWRQVNKEMPWIPRYYHDVSVFDNKLWITGGYAYFTSEGTIDNYEPLGNLSDTWFSEDGVNWTMVVNTEWPMRHAQGVWPASDALYVGAGNLWNDVAKLTLENSKFEGYGTYYRDRDYDGYGDPATKVLAPHEDPTGHPYAFVKNNTDSNDRDITTH